jgi:hypothetical protein
MAADQALLSAIKRNRTCIIFMNVDNYAPCTRTRQTVLFIALVRSGKYRTSRKPLYDFKMHACTLYIVLRE